MTEIPEHLLRRSDEARAKASGQQPANDPADTAETGERPSVDDFLHQLREGLSGVLRDPIGGSFFEHYARRLNARQELTDAIKRSLEGLEDGELLKLTIGRLEGKTNINLVLDDTALVRLIVSLLEDL